MRKFPLLHHILLHEGLITPAEVFEPHPVEWTDLLLVHTAGYLDNLAAGTLGSRAEKRIGLPWTPRLVRRSRLAVQGTIMACRMALQDGIAANLAGGTHHAFPDHGEGFCVLNDTAVAIRVLQRGGAIDRALVIDLDVHHGNGTAAIFERDPSVFTFSMHGEKNYPWRKPPSSRDVGLPDGTGDDAYLKALRDHLPDVLDEARADLVLYLAGVDPVQGDRFGRLALTHDGLRRRDRAVLETVKERSLPLVILMAGGYAATAELTANLHAIVHREAWQVHRQAVQA
jgi:acetoin utilization deacetylase AcuC-like enzyme